VLVEALDQDPGHRPGRIAAARSVGNCADLRARDASLS
jgi:hypothetical protein